MADVLLSFGFEWVVHSDCKMFTIASFFFFFALCGLQGTTGQKREWDNRSSKRQVSPKTCLDEQESCWSMLVIIIRSINKTHQLHLCGEFIINLPLHARYLAAISYVNHQSVCLTAPPPPTSFLPSCENGLNVQFKPVDGHLSETVCCVLRIVLAPSRNACSPTASWPPCWRWTRPCQPTFPSRSCRRSLPPSPLQRSCCWWANPPTRPPLPLWSSFIRRLTVNMHTQEKKGEESSHWVMRTD